eukprot:962187-Rhodomonas_salina.2
MDPRSGSTAGRNSQRKWATLSDGFRFAKTYSGLFSDAGVKFRAGEGVELGGRRKSSEAQRSGRGKRALEENRELGVSVCREIELRAEGRGRSRV